MSTPDQFHSSSAPTKPDSGPFLARVISHQDPEFMGSLQVEILRPVGNRSTGSELRTVSYMSPFYGVTGAQFTSETNDYDGTQKSYGMWMVPPDIGTTVVIFFIQGDPKRGYWIGCVQDESMNFMVPGIASTGYTVDGTGRVPVAEYNKKLNNSNASSTTFNKPKHPFGDVLTTQGLIKDDIRGITSSSARREAPSMVFGISTPGPVDRRTNAPRGEVGQSDSAVPNAFVSRLGGSTFVMDDGDASFLRKTLASDGPPDYASVEDNETTGNRTIPHNELVRIRTRTGHQILLHNSEDLIYIGNAKGTTWIELTSNGKIDIYAKDSISVHSENDINFTADRDINLTAKRNFNLNSAGANNLTATGATNIRSGGNHVETAANIHMNGPAAVTAPKAARIPQHEPWAGHENLNPMAHTPAKTAAVAAPVAPTSAFYNKYTTSVDTFKRVPPPAKGN
jgi:hypothetical protein